MRDGELAGIHLEGPWLSADHCGAHDPGALRAPDPGEVSRVLDAGGGAVRMVTLAPELDGGLDAVRLLARRGVVAALGHTDATYAVTRQALDAGATVGTHLFNAMRGLHHREPGPCWPCWALGRVRRARRRRHPPAPGRAAVRRHLGTTASSS